MLPGKSFSGGIWKVQVTVGVVHPSVAQDAPWCVLEIESFDMFGLSQDELSQDLYGNKSLCMVRRLFNNHCVMFLLVAA